MSAPLPFINTALYAAIMAVFVLVLSLRVSLGRQRFRTSVGDGGHPELAHRIRVHGNLIENAPIALILLALIESTGSSTALVHALGIVFVVLRLLQARGLSDGRPGTLRFIGSAGTLVYYGVAAAVLFVRVIAQ